LRRLFSSRGGNHQAKVAEGHLDRFPRLRSFHRASPSDGSFFLLLFLSCEKSERFLQKVFAPEVTIERTGVT
jgi:hypothetical protein